jgi:hypothetical protein
MVTEDERIHERVLCEVMRRMADEFDLSLTPAHVSTQAVRIACQVMGVEDPYAEVKREFNELGLRMYPRLREIVRDSDDPLRTALRLAAAGNVIDFGAGSPYKIEEEVEEVLRSGFALDHYDAFREELSRNELIYILDNAGEILFDRLLMEELIRLGVGRITALVKSKPILNDATREDAEMVGIGELAEVVETGTGYLGLPVDLSPPEMIRRIENAPLVIAKGQANFETLDELNANIFFILKAKCPLVADRIGIELGELAFFRRRT